MASSQDATFSCPPFSGLKVIGAGLGRTGTLSLKMALEKLGLGPCYHMLEVFLLDHAGLWRDISLGKPVDWAKIYAPLGGVPPGKGGGKGKGKGKGKPSLASEHTRGPHFQSSVDLPSAAWYLELIETYPDAKVILTVRDSPEQWYASAVETIMSEHTRGLSLARRFQLCTNPKQWSFFHEFLRPACYDRVGLPQEVAREKAAACEAYQAWISRVKATVPAEKLLVFNVKEGWEPLCQFLSLPVPEEDFPKANESAEFKQWLVLREAMARKALGKAVMLTALAAVAVSVLGRLMAKRR